MPVIVHLVGGELSRTVEESLDEVNEILNNPNLSASTIENPNKVQTYISLYPASVDTLGNLLPTPGLNSIPLSQAKNLDLEFLTDLARENYWDPNKYINIYLVDGDYSELTGGEFNPAGWANFASSLTVETPGLNTISSEPNQIIFNAIFQNNNMSGDVIAHEFGHLLNLHHNFSQACLLFGDYLEDTYSYQREGFTALNNCNASYPLINSNVMD